MKREVLLVLVLVLALGTHLVWYGVTTSGNEPGASVFRDHSPGSIGKTWTITGSPGSSHLAITDSAGGIQPRQDSYCVYFFLYDRDQRKLYTPLLHNVRPRASMLNGCAPCVTWLADGVNWSQTIFADASVCHSTLTITNKAAEAKRLSVFAAVLPHQVTGGIRSGFSLACNRKSGLILVDGKVVLCPYAPADAMGAALGEQGTDITCFLRKGVLPKKQSARADLSRISSGAMRFDLDLKPGSSRRLRFGMPMADLTAVQWYRQRKGGDDTLADFTRRWDRRLGHVGLQLPDRRAVDCFRASLAYLLMLSGDGKPVPGPAKYHSFWVRDAAYMADALYYAGQRDLVPAALARIRTMQLPNGGFLPKTGAKDDNELDAPGEAIYALVQQYRRTRDARSLRDAWPCILSACRYIRAKRIPGSGILPASVSAEDLGKGDQQHYWDDFWCVRGLRDGAYAAKAFGKLDDAAWIQREADSLLNATLASARRALLARDAADYIPNGPQDLTSSSMARGTSCALWPCEVLSPESPLTTSSFNTYWAKWVAPSSGGFVHNKGHYWPYAGLDLAQCYLMLGQRERVWQILDWTLEHDPTDGFYSWPEGMSRRDLTLAEGDMPHGWMCAAYVSLIRNMLVRESGRGLELLSGVPEQWLKPGSRILVERLPTERGEISFRAEVSRGGLKLTFLGKRPTAPCHLVLPGNKDTIIPAAASEVTVSL